MFLFNTDKLFNPDEVKFLFSTFYDIFYFSAK